MTHSGLYRRLAATSLRKNGRTYLPYLLSAMGTVAMFYIIAYLATDSGGGAVATVMQLGAGVVGVFALVFLFYTNSFLIKRRKKELGLYGILGMEKRHLARMLAWETLYCFLLSTALGLAGGVLLSKAVSLLLLKITGASVRWGFAFSPLAARLTVGLFGGIFLLTLLSNLRQVHISQPIELLRGGQVGEREPRARWLLAALGLVCLGAGYWLALTIEDPLVALLWFFAAVLLVILGTLLLFTATSVAFLKLLRRNKNYYYQTRHIISVSGMMYRMKQNAVGLTNICILSTMLLVMVSSTTALYAGVEDMLASRYGRTFEVVTTEEDFSPRAAAMDALNQAGLEPLNTQTFSSLTFAALGVEGGFEARQATAEGYDPKDVVSLSVLTLGDYNLLTGQNAALAPGEVLFSQPEMADAQGQLSLLGSAFTVVGPARHPGIVCHDSLEEPLYLVVAGQEELHRIADLQREVYGENASQVRYSFAFDLDVSPEECMAFEANVLRKTVGNHAGEMVRIWDDPDKLAIWFVYGRESARKDTMDLMGSFFFLGLFLGLLFLMATALIIYYKQISEGYDDRERFAILQKVGMGREEIRAAIRSQVLTVFFLPLVTAGVHVAFAFKMITLLLSLFQLTNVMLFAATTLGSFLLFALVYAGIYAITARSYYRIVS